MALSMPKWLKLILLSLLAVLLTVGAGVYFYLKSIGIIPKHDYDTVAPNIPHFSRPAVLVFNKTNGFRHVEALPVADQMFKELSAAHGWDVFVTDNAAVHNPGVLDKFQLVVWNNVSGDVLTAEQRNSLKQWIEAGGGWVGVHGSGGDPSYDWRWYVDTLIGAQFVGHTMSPQFQDADVLVADLTLPLTAHLPSPWNIRAEEWYAFDTSPRHKGYEILLTIDEGSYLTVGGNSWGWIDNMKGEHPLAWRHSQGEGRVFYSAIGHQPATYQIPGYRELLSKAMVWAMGAADGAASQQ
jgi:type 1 glutamine amidotransferase